MGVKKLNIHYSSDFIKEVLKTPLMYTLSEMVASQLPELWHLPRK